MEKPTQHPALRSKPQNVRIRAQYPDNLLGYRTSLF